MVASVAMQPLAEHSATGDGADECFMEVALRAARRAGAIGEVPVGAVLVRAGRVIGLGCNGSIASSDPTAHAEILALRDGAGRLGNYRLVGTTLYVTVEPCLMCVGALLHARVARVVFGCAEPRSGALGSMYDVGRDGRGSHRLETCGGVRAAAARDLLQEFFRMRRGA